MTKGGTLIETIKKPTTKIADLKKEERAAVLTLIRHLIQPIEELTQTLGFEATEENVVKFINDGLVKIVYDEESNGYYLQVYDFKLGRYRP